MHTVTIPCASFVNILSAWTVVSQIKPDLLLCTPPMKMGQGAFEITVIYRLLSQQLEFPLPWRGAVGVAGFAAAGWCGDVVVRSRKLATRCTSPLFSDLRGEGTRRYATQAPGSA